MMRPKRKSQKPRTPYGVWVHRMIFVLAGRLYGDECSGEGQVLDLIRRDIVDLGIGPRPSLSSLSVAGKVKLLNAYEKKLGQSRVHRLPANYDPVRRAGHSGNPSALPTVDQRVEMERMFNELGYPGPAERQGYSKRACGRRTPATIQDAGKVINGLKAMRARGWRWGDK